MKTIAIIPAGGAGKRLKAHVAKQYLFLDHMPVLVHTLKVFQKSKVIDNIVLAVPPDDLVSIRQELIDKYGLTKVDNYCCRRQGTSGFSEKLLFRPLTANVT